MGSLEKYLSQLGLLLIDVQEKLFKKIYSDQKLEKKLLCALYCFETLGISPLVTEQYPRGLGSTISSLQRVLSPKTLFLEKTAFSCFKELNIQKALLEKDKKTWILMGIESHICIWQTAKDLVNYGYEVIVLEDCVGSREIFYKERAIKELEQISVRVTSLETYLFELLEDATHPAFREISKLLTSFA